MHTAYTGLSIFKFFGLPHSPLNKKIQNLFPYINCYKFDSYEISERSCILRQDTWRIERTRVYLVPRTIKQRRIQSFPVYSPTFIICRRTAFSHCSLLFSYSQSLVLSFAVSRSRIRSLSFSHSQSLVLAFTVSRSHVCSLSFLTSIIPEFGISTIKKKQIIKI
jgi:hypothetical protein